MSGTIVAASKTIEPSRKAQKSKPTTRVKDGADIWSKRVSLKAILADPENVEARERYAKQLKRKESPMAILNDCGGKDQRVLMLIIVMLEQGAALTDIPSRIRRYSELTKGYIFHFGARALAARRR